ncbi:hypothetical protein, variant [Exophiala xenobiotica]|uniref:Glutathione S-transferase n=1 Tax=Exophiala xenobiotica TaxID=348802 RepID=A0A0D2EKL0_9EURO|nr:uncharacterized protein PV05_04666 [Exophiala xenobiotica]XP_013316547.1 hypothetical protein, variant [Exophiala xenobiotica]KIW55962.1 hypothetical protein PV05_04666 [Exophiala xenobiotica]KIW55963.1 hypothetical protein, variant [Exophiala xenobiotica]
MADSKPTLHHLNDSQSQRILWLLEELEIPYDLVLHKRNETGPNKRRAPEELKKTHFLGKSPQLCTSDGRVVIESLVIARYLIDKYDKKDRFKGDGDWLRDDELCNIAAATIGIPMSVEVLFTMMAKLSPFFLRPLIYPIHRGIHQGYSGPELDLNFGYLDEQLGDREYFGGSSPSRADFILSWPMDVCALNHFIDLEKFPALAKWHKRCQERPAWKRALEKGNGYNLKY